MKHHRRIRRAYSVARKGCPYARTRTANPFAFATALGAVGCASISSPSTDATPTGAEALYVGVPQIPRPGGETSTWWFRDGAAQAAARGAMAGRAKNVILFVGDGMSLTTVAAARILEGQRKGGPGKRHGVGVYYLDAKD